MLRTLNIALIALMLGGAGVVYQLKYEAERAANKVSKVSRKIEQERDAIATLKAEWSLLNQPKRLQELVERYRSYLELDPLDPMQIGAIDEIPFRPQPAADKGLAPTGPQPVTPLPNGPRNAQASMKLNAGAAKSIEHTGSIPPKSGPKATDRAPTAPKVGDPTKAQGVDPRPNDPLLKILH